MPRQLAGEHRPSPVQPIPSSVIRPDPIRPLRSYPTLSQPSRAHPTPPTRPSPTSPQPTPPHSVLRPLLPHTHSLTLTLSHTQAPGHPTTSYSKHHLTPPHIIPLQLLCDILNMSSLATSSVTLTLPSTPLHGDLLCTSVEALNAVGLRSARASSDCVRVDATPPHVLHVRRE